MIAIFVAGLVAYINLPISNMPDVSYPTINVKVTFPGALPETMGDAVALPLEKQFMGIPGLRLVYSTSTLGSTSIILQFEIDKDITTAAQDVQSAITVALPNLPPNLPFGPVYRKVNPAEQPIIYISLTSKTMPRTELYTYANTLIGQRISMLQGVSQVTTYGSIKAIRVQVDPEQLVAHDITLIELADAIELGNPILATGQLDGVVEAPIISVNGQMQHDFQYDDLIVAYRNGTPVRVSDLGKAIENFQNNKILTQFVDENGVQPSITLAIQKEPGANTVAIADAIYDLLASLHTEMPPAIDVHIVYDRSIPVRAAIHDATKTLVVALFLVVFVIFVFLGKFTETIIPSLVLPLSVFGTFIVMGALHFTLDSLSVLALTLAVGFIIDDAVVVLENIVRRVEEGDPPMQAAFEGSRQICFTIVSMTLSLIAVFIPMLFMGGLIGKLFSEFAITLTAITIISGMIALTLTPMLCSRFIPPREKGERQGSKMAEWSENLNQGMQKGYRRMLSSVLDHQRTALAIGVLCLVATVALFYYIPTDFTPNEDVGFFTIYTQSRQGGSSYRMQEFQNQVIDILRHDPAVESFISINAYTEYRKGLNFVHLKPIEQRPPIEKVIEKLNAQFTEIPGLQAFIKNIPLIDIAAGQENRASYQFALHSLYPDKLYPSARKLIEKMQGSPLFQGVFSDMEIDTPQLNVHIKRDKASSLGIDANDVENTFQLGYSGNLISVIQTAIDQYDVILELYPDLQRSTDTLNKIWLRSSISNELVPLDAVMEWSEGLGSSSANHINQFPSVIISFNLAPGVPLESGLSQIEKFSHEVVAAGVNAIPIGAAQTFNESIKSAGFLLLVTIFAIYIILGILYESFIHPITILTTLPPATLGGLLVLLVLDLPLSLYSFLGIILLIGIVKKNGIMVVDFALDNIRHKGLPPKEAILDASLVRLRPILMTTAAAIFGVLPIAMGLGANAAARRPLGYVIIGGLLLSQLITLFLTPILYLVMETWSEKMGWR